MAFRNVSKTIDSIIEETRDSHITDLLRQFEAGQTCIGCNLMYQRVAGDPPIQTPRGYFFHGSVLCAWCTSERLFCIAAERGPISAMRHVRPEEV